jgi:hypothetical protein
MAKFHRKPIIKKKKAEIVNVDPFQDWDIKVGNGKTIKAFSFQHIHEGERILSELNIFLRPQRNASPNAYAILGYINFIASIDSLVSRASLIAYKDHLDEKKMVEVNTKADLFGRCIQFFVHLISAEVIKQEKKPKNFKRIPVEPKATFAEIATRDSFFLTK